MTNLTAGLLFSDRIEALLVGRVSLTGRTLSISCRQAQPLFRAVLREAAFDVAELSLCSYIAAVAAGRSAYVGLPVFPSRAFRHGNLYVRSDRIRQPEDLAGKRIGLIDFQQTAAMWLRGILADEYGVQRESVTWITGGLHAPELSDRVSSHPPAGMTIHRSPEALDTLIRAGEIDAIISPAAPHSHADPAVPVERMWPDFAGAQRDWWQRCHIFPIMHVLVVRRTCVEADSALPAALCEAFDKALVLARRDLVQRDFPKLALANQYAAAQEADTQFGADLWATGLGPNRRVLETALANAHADGLTKGALAVDDLFSM